MKTLLAVVGLAILSFNTYAIDIKNGKSLHTQNCQACHTTHKYKSNTRTVQNLPDLVVQVKRCDFSLGTQWFDEDISDVVAYLNHDFYQFKPEAKQ